MGITGLLPLLKAASVRVHVSAYRGQRVAIDAYGWLHRGAYNCASEIAQGKHTEGFVRFCIHRARQLRHLGVEPIFVFDGSALPAKRLIEEDRERRRELHRAKGLEFLKQKRSAEALAEFQKCVNISPKLAHQLIQALRADGLLYVVAPYEADAQIAYLFRIGAVSAVIAEDSDMLAFGCQRVLFKMDKEGYVDEVLLSKLAHADRLNLTKFTPQKFQQLCVLSGCDYLASIHGVGPLKAATALNRHHDAMHGRPAQAVNSLLIAAGATDAERKVYRHGFRLAVLAFRHQTVFDPATASTVPLFPITDDLNEEEQQFIGAHLNGDVARELALGNLDPHTMKRMDHYAPAIGCSPYDAIIAPITHPHSTEAAAPGWDELMLTPFKPKPSLESASPLPDLPDMPDFFSTPAPTGPLKQATLASFGLTPPLSTARASAPASAGSASTLRRPSSEPHRPTSAGSAAVRPAGPLSAFEPGRSPSTVDPLPVSGNLKSKLAAFAFGRASAPTPFYNDDDLEGRVSATPSPTPDSATEAEAAADTGSPDLLQRVATAPADLAGPDVDSDSPVLLPTDRAAQNAQRSILVPESPERRPGLSATVAHVRMLVLESPDSRTADHAAVDEVDALLAQSPVLVRTTPAAMPLLPGSLDANDANEADGLLAASSPLLLPSFAAAAATASASVTLKRPAPLNADLASIDDIENSMRPPSPVLLRRSSEAVQQLQPMPQWGSTAAAAVVRGSNSGGMNRFAKFSFRATDAAATHPYHLDTTRRPIGVAAAPDAKRARAEPTAITPPLTPLQRLLESSKSNKPKDTSPAVRMAAFLDDQV